MLILNLGKGFLIMEGLKKSCNLSTQYRVDKNLLAVVQHPNNKTYLNIFSSYELRGITPLLTQRKNNKRNADLFAQGG